MSATNGKLPRPTDEQWEAIRETESHLLVDAGAGTGKTFTVVSKILYLLGVEIRGETYHSPIALRDLAAITFTNRAAAELKDRLRKGLRDVGRRGDAHKVDGARVGTIHAFCGDILREFALRSGRPPNLGLLDDAESLALRDEVVREALLGSLQSNSVPGLADLLNEREVKDVEQWTRDLLSQGDALRGLIDAAPGLPPAERALLGLAKEAHSLVLRRLAESGQMDFDRMIVWTRDLIRDDPVVRKALQRRIRFLIIDEFQDVDPVQREIAYLLGDPTSRRKDTTRLVLVGDPKQSIYRFRRADVTVWSAAARDLQGKGVGKIVKLTANRRSVAPILGFVDHAIGTLLDKPIDGASHRDFEIPYSGLVSIRDDGPTDGAVELLLIPELDGESAGKAGDIRAVEAAALAKRARELHDRDNVPWSKMAILLTAWTDADVYTRALAADGIPSYELRDEGFYERREVIDLIVALQAIRDPEDDRALMGFLRSPFVGLTDESLLSIAIQCAGRYWSAREKISLKDPSEAEILAHGIRLLERLVALRDRVPIPELLNDLLDSSAYVAHLALLGDGAKQAIANVRKLVRMAGSSHETSVGGLLSVIARERKLKVLEGSARLHGESDDVVTVTSVHMAKGLEWDVVFWADLIRPPRDVHSKLKIGRETIALGDADLPPKEQRAEWKAIDAACDAEDEAEKKRLWYVASTRAKDRLILTGIPLGTGAFKNGPAMYVRSVFPKLLDGSATYEARDGRHYAAVLRYAEVPDEMVVASADTPLPVGDLAALAPPVTPVAVASARHRHSATELMTHERCPRRHWFKYVVGLREPGLTGRRPGKDEIDAVKRGLIVHDVLERYEAETELDELLEEAIGRWDPAAPAIDGARGRRYRAKLMGHVDAVLGHPEYQAVAGRPGARRELSFMHILGPRSVVEGKIDLVGPDAAGYDIIDVKTTECDEETARRKADGYTLQRAAYVRAVEGAVEGGSVRAFGFLFSGAKVNVARPVDSDGRRTMLMQLQLALSEVQTGSRDLTVFAAECQWCGYLAAGWCEGAPTSRAGPRGQLASPTGLPTTMAPCSDS